MKSFLEKVWEIDPANLSPTLLDEILSDLITSRADNDEITIMLKDTRQLISSLGLNEEGGIFANGKYIEKDSVIFIY
jgi:hypothetical protein